MRLHAPWARRGHGASGARARKRQSEPLHVAFSCFRWKDSNVTYNPRMKSRQPKKLEPLSIADQLQLAAASLTDPRSVARYLRGEKVRTLTAERIRLAAAKLGYAERIRLAAKLRYVAAGG